MSNNPSQPMKKSASTFVEINGGPRPKTRRTKARRSRKLPLLVLPIVFVVIGLSAYFLVFLIHHPAEVPHDTPSTETSQDAPSAEVSQDAPSAEVSQDAPSAEVSQDGSSAESYDGNSLAGTTDDNSSTKSAQNTPSAESTTANSEPTKKQPDNLEQPSKIIYLTFDDGPGPYTAGLLDTLKKYNVKATFFVTGAGDDSLLAREHKEGHTIGLHTFSHNYAYIYANTTNFFADLDRVQTRVKNVTGTAPYLIRFPGGSSNTISANYDNKSRIMSQLVSEVSARGYTYFDWNISSGDAGGTTSTEQVYQNVVNNLKPDASVVLQHDIKDFSVAAVERIIQYGLANGYTFSKLDASSYPAHHSINN